MKKASVDTSLALLIAVLVFGGALIFASAAFGLLARGANHIPAVALRQVIWIATGLVALFIASRIDYALWRRYAPHAFVLALIATAAVFLPHIGIEHGGGRRWMALGGITVQPSEALKLGSILIAAAYFASIHARINDIRYGLGGLLAILAGPVLLLVMQPDLGTLSIIILSVCAIFFAAGANWRDLAILVITGVLALALLAFFKPYVMDRIQVFFNPAQGQQAEGYQIKQSLIAIGSGGFFGRGFGQGVQKFTYLPEPMGDSIFAVAGEEFGLVGTCAIIGLFLAFALRGLSTATKARDAFGTFLAIGISVYLASEAFINIGAMLGLGPLTGIPLTFISQGGSAMLVSLASAGVLLNVSRHRSRR